MRRLQNTVLSMVIMLVVSGMAYGKGAGTTACNFLKMGIGARPVAMGEAYTAVGEDADVMGWNPAGLAYLKGGSLKAMHNQWFEGIGMDYVGFAHSVGKKGAMGVSGRYLWMGRMDVTSAENPDGTGETFTAYDVAGTVSYGQRINDKLSAGMSVKIIQQKIDTASGMAYAADAGGIYEINDRIRVGGSLSNIGTQMKLVKEGYPLPAEWRAGIGCRLLRRKNLTVGGDIRMGIAQGLSAHTGAEIMIKDMIALRAGYKTDTISDINYLSGLSAGMGFGGNGWEMDYAWVPYGDLGSTHRVSLGVRFGGEEKVSAKMSRREKTALMKKHYTRGQKLYESGKYKEAIREWEKVLVIDPGHTQTRQVIERVKKQIQAMKTANAKKK